VGFGSHRPLEEDLVLRRDFRFLLLGQTTSQLGTQVSGVAVPLLAVLTLNASPFQLGVLGAAGTLAFAVIGLQAGAWLDRMRRRPVLVASDVVRAVLLLTVPVAAWLDRLTIAHLLVVALLVGAARVFFDIGYQSYLPTVTGNDRLLAANSAMEALRAGGQVVGPGLGGGLVALAGAANVLLLQAVTFAVSAVSLLAIRTPEPAPPPPVGRVPLRTQIGAGLRFVLGDRVIRATAVTSALGNLSFAVASAVTVVFMVRDLGLSATGVGLVVAAGSVTVMAGAALTPRLARLVGEARIVWLSLAVTGPVGLLVPLARPGWGIALLVVGMAVGELGQIVYAITNVTLRQRRCPSDLLGRVSATMRFLIMGMFPLGALLGGVLGSLVGVRATLWVAGGLIVVSAVPVYRALRYADRGTDAAEARPVG
jgi:MFS family permease